MIFLPQVLLLLSITPLALASRLSFAGQTAGINTPQFSQRVGPPLTTGASLTGSPVWFLEMETSVVCLSELDMTGAVVNTRDARALNLREVSLVANCAAAKGAIALIVTTEDFVSGRYYYAHQLVHQPVPVTIPVLQVTARDLERAEHALATFANITIELFVGENEWKGVVPVLSGLAAIHCATSIRMHYRKDLKLARERKLRNRFVPKRDHRQFIATTALAYIALGLEVMASLTIFIYSALGPIFGKSVLPYELHVVMFTLPLAFSGSGAFISVTLLLRWGTFTISKLKTHVEASAILLAFALPLFNFLGAIAWLVGAMSTYAFIRSQGAAMFVFTLTDFGAFVGFSLRFLRTLRHGNKQATDTMLLKRTVLIKRFLRWIFFVIISHLGTFGSIMFPIVALESFRQPQTFCIVWLVGCISIIVQSSAQAYGLNPIHARNTLNTVHVAPCGTQPNRKSQSFKYFPDIMRRGSWTTEAEGNGDPLRPVAVYPILQHVQKMRKSQSEVVEWVAEEGFASAADCVV